MDLAAGLNPFLVLSMYLSLHDPLVNLTHVNLSVLRTGFILCVFSLSYGWTRVQYKSVCIYGWVPGHIWSMMTPGLQTGSDSSLQVLRQVVTVV